MGPEAKLTRRQDIIGMTEVLKPIEKMSFKNFACKGKKRNWSKITGRRWRGFSRNLNNVGNLPGFRESS